jgi:hypothetical protein
MTRKISPLVLVLASCLGFSLPLAAAPLLSFDETGVTAQVTPGATTALFGITHEWGPYRLRTFERAFMLEDADEDGVVHADLAHADQFNGVWMAVDMVTGERVVEATGEQAIQRDELAPEAFLPAGVGTVASVNQSETFAITWFVRPGVGVWTATVEDGAVGDGDALSNGNISATLDHMSAVGSSPEPPDDFRAGDIVAVVAPMTLKISDGRIEE